MNLKTKSVVLILKLCFVFFVGRTIYINYASYSADRQNDEYC